MPVTWGAVVLAKAIRPPGTRYCSNPVENAVASWPAVARTGMLKPLALTDPGCNPAPTSALFTDSMVPALGPNRLTNARSLR